MGIFGLGPKTAKEEYTCKNCGATIKAGERYTMDGSEYICDKCSHAVKKEAKKNSGTCEFC